MGLRTGQQHSEWLLSLKLLTPLPPLQILSVEQPEGAGARVRRSIGRPELKNFDPFLMLVCIWFLIFAY